MITAAKSCQNIIDILGAQKPTWKNFSEFAFFLPEKTKLYRYYQNKNKYGDTTSSARSRRFLGILFS